MGLVKFQSRKRFGGNGESDGNLLSADEERRLADRWRIFRDQRALERLILAHRMLVKRIASEFRTSGPAMEDLIQEGYLGLTIAAHRFDPTREARLSTYAAYWIRAIMLELVVRSCGPVRIGTTRWQRRIFFGLARARRALERTNVPTDRSHLAEFLQVNEDDFEVMASRLARNDVYLDAPVPSGEGGFAQNVLMEEAQSPEEILGDTEEGHHHKRQLREGLKDLDVRERSIIQMRYLEENPATLTQLGALLGISRERVRQIEHRALTKLRHLTEEEDTPRAA